MTESFDRRRFMTLAGVASVAAGPLMAQTVEGQSHGRTFGLVTNGYDPVIEAFQKEVRTSR